jgi:Exocyst complex component Sec3
MRASIIESPSRGEKERGKERDKDRPVGEIFDEILSIVVPAFIREQSFIMEFLHLSPSWKYTFEDFVATQDKNAWVRNLDTKRPPELDKAAATEVSGAMEQMLSWLPDELASLWEWCRTLDSMYAFYHRL